MNVLDIDFSEKRVWAGMGRAIGQGAGIIYEAAPKRAIAGYAGIMIGLGLWIAPLSQKVDPRLSVALSLCGAAALAASANELEDLQEDIEESRENRQLSRALRQTANESVQSTQHYAAVTATRLAASQGLPGHLVEPDLVPQKDGAQGYIAGQPTMAEFDALVAKEEKKLGTASGETVEEASTATSQATYKFWTQKNPRSNATERFIDLEGSDSYCGLPIVDLAAEMASDPRGCLGFGSTGCGKSELLKQAISAQVKVDSASDFTVFAHKSGNSKTGEEIDYAGLENSSDCFVFTASQTNETLEDEAERFERRVKVLEGLIEEGCLAPTVVVIDQANQGIKAAQKAHRQAKQRRELYNSGLPAKDKDTSPIDFKYLAEDYSEFINTGLVDGRTKKVKLWSFGHANTNESAGVSHQIKQNVFFVGLGRAGNYQAVENPLKDNRFISSKNDRERLQLQLNEYLKQHRENGSPVNVVVAITTCGNENWRLVVLPQYKPVEPIALSYTNPAKEESTEVKDTGMNPSQNQLNALEAAYAASYTSEQVEAARRFIPWLKANYAAHCDEQGLVNPQTVWPYFGVAGSEDMEACLQVLNDQGAGQFVMVGNSTRWEPDKKLRPKTQSVSYTVGKPANIAPTGLNVEAIQATLTHLQNKQIGTYHTLSEFLNSSRVLRQAHGMDVGKLSDILSILERRDVIAFTDVKRNQFQYKGAIA